MFKKNIRFSVRNHLKYNADCTIVQKIRQTEKKRKTEKKQRAAMKTKKITVVTQKAIEQKIIVVRKQSSKINSNFAIFLNRSNLKSLQAISIRHR